MGASRICTAVGNAARMASYSMTDESSDPDYSLGWKPNPAETTRTESAYSDTIILTPLGSQTVKAVVVHNTNASTGSVTSNTGLGPITLTGLAQRDKENRPIHVLKDIEGLPGSTATQFSITLGKTASGPVLEFGQIWLVTEWKEAEILYGVQWGHDRPGFIRKRTKLGRIVDWISGQKIQRMIGQVRDGSTLANWLEIEAETSGIGYPFLLQPYRTENRVFVCTFTDPTKFRYDHEERPLDEPMPVIDLRIEIEEINTGDAPRYV